jgi:hypothetical protein
MSLKQFLGLQKTFLRHPNRFCLADRIGYVTFFVKPIHGVPVKSLPCPCTQTLLSFMGHQIEKRQRKFIYFIFVVVHSSSCEGRASGVTGSRRLEAIRLQAHVGNHSRDPSGPVQEYSRLFFRSLQILLSISRIPIPTVTDTFRFSSRARTVAPPLYVTSRMRLPCMKSDIKASAFFTAWTSPSSLGIEESR